MSTDTQEQKLKLKLCVNKILNGLKQDSLTNLTKTNLEELFWNCLEDNLVYVPIELHQFFKKMWFFSSNIKEIVRNLIEKSQPNVYYIDLPENFNINMDFDWEENEEIICNNLNSNKEFYKKKYCLNRGDIVILSCGGSGGFENYRNDGILIWNGDKFLALESDYDDYGHIPKEFLTFQEFPLYYFNSSIAHNQICHTDISKLNSIESVITINNENFHCEIGEQMFCNTFIFNEKTYKIGSKFSLKNKTLISFDYDEDLEEFFDFVVFC